MIVSIWGITSGVLLLKAVKMLEILKKLSCWITKINYIGIISQNNLTVP